MAQPSHPVRQLLIEPENERRKRGEEERHKQTVLCRAADSEKTHREKGGQYKKDEGALTDFHLAMLAPPGPTASQNVQGSTSSGLVKADE